MDLCFVMQPFDKGKFDKRFDDVFSPAIKEAGLKPYRVDRDPTVSVPIEKIEKEIQSSRMCLAEITSDNPNVWFELGYAIAARKDVVLVCSKERETPFPFDVRHRTIIEYKTDSSSDFRSLKDAIVSKIAAILETESTLGSLVRLTATETFEGLEGFEIATLVSVGSQHPDPHGGIGSFRIQKEMESAGFARIATTLGLSRLCTKGFLESFEGYDQEYLYRVSNSGLNWLCANTDKINMRAEPAPPNDALPF